MRIATTGMLGSFLACLVAACSGTSPETPSGPSPVPTPSQAAAQGTPASSLTGAVLENGGRLTVGGRLQYLFGPTSDSQGGIVPVRSDGGYTVPSVPHGTRVNLLFLPNTGVAGGSLHQPCAAYATVSKPTVLSVELVSKGIPPSDPTPTLSGVVFRRDRGETIPLTATLMYSGAAATRADDAGRYSLCRLPPGPGQLLVGATCNDAWMYVPVVIDGDTVADIDMTEWFSTCPGFIEI